MKKLLENQSCTGTEVLAADMRQHFAELLQNDEEMSIIVECLAERLAQKLQSLGVYRTAATDESEAVSQCTEDAARMATLHARLLPFFFYDDGEVDEFIDNVIGKRMTYITRYVNHLVRTGKIEPASTHRPLYTVLHDAGIYSCSETNWNKQII